MPLERTFPVQSYVRKPYTEGMRRFFHLPRIVAAQSLQSWLLVTALAALILMALLVFDLSRNLRSVVVSETRGNLENAVGELLTARPDWPVERLAQHSYETLRSYLDVEGGYWRDGQILGQSFPSYTEPGSQLRLPDNERGLVLDAYAASRQTGETVTRTLPDGPDLLVVAVKAAPSAAFAAWTLRRLINFSDSSELNRRFLLVAVMLLALVAIATVLALSFRLQRGFSDLQAGLARLRHEPDFRLAPQGSDLQPVIAAVNEMAASRQRLEAEIRREDRLRSMGRLVASIAHEIRNPLNSMRLTARLLARRLEGNAAAQPAQLIVDEVDRLDALLRSLLALQPEEPLAVTPQPVLPVLERTLQVVGPHAREAGVELVLAAPAPASALLDPGSLQQALLNLLLNAIDAAGGRGRVTLSLTATAAAVIIAVQDEGPGLTPEALERLCEPFFTTKPGGTGLGLALTKSLLERMGAQLQASNTNPGARLEIHLSGAPL